MSAQDVVTYNNFWSPWYHFIDYVEVNIAEVFSVHILSVNILRKLLFVMQLHWPTVTIITNHGCP